VKVAQVGLGYWGPKLLRNLVERLGESHVVAVDSNAQRLRDLARVYPSVASYTSLDDALADAEVGAVVIATPLETHYHLTKAALEAGRHVLVEKPMATSSQEADELADLAECRGLTLMAGHTFLFSPRVEFIHDYLRGGGFGQMLYVTSERLNLGLHRRDANVIWDLAPHDFSILLHLLGETPSTVQTVARCSGGFHLPEVAFMTLGFASGVIAQVTSSWVAPLKVRRSVFVGSDQMILYDDTNAEESVKVYDKGVEIPDSSSFADNIMTYRFGDTRAPHISSAEPLGRQIAHFLDCAESGARCRSDGRFGAEVVRVLEAAQCSWMRGGAPVSLANRDGSIEMTHELVRRLGQTLPAFPHPLRRHDDRGLLTEVAAAV
jgi:predicted dehydrogenase